MYNLNMEGLAVGNKIQKTKAEVLEEIKTEPLKYVLEIHDVKNAKELVEKLSMFETNAGFENVFEKLKNISNLENTKVIFKSLNYLGDPKDNYTNASYRQANNTLYIDFTYGNSADIGEFYVTILHELFHNIFKGADIASGLNLIYGLTNIKNTINKLPIHNKYRHLYQTILHNVSKEDKKNHYGLSSVDEFISESYSNPKFQNFLKTVELNKRRNITDKTKDLLLSVVTLNNRIFSKEIEEKNAFEAFQKIDIGSLDLLEDFNRNLKIISESKS